MKRAGDVIGTPDWQLDRMYETETEKMLEKAFAEDDFPISAIESDFSQARDHISQAVRFLIRAANEADKYGRAQPIDELIEKLDDDLDYEVGRVLKKLKEGA